MGTSFWHLYDYVSYRFGHKWIKICSIMHARNEVKISDKNYIPTRCFIYPDLQSVVVFDIFLSFIVFITCLGDL